VLGHGLHSKLQESESHSGLGFKVLKDSGNYILLALKACLLAEYINAFCITLRISNIHKIAKQNCWLHLVCLHWTTELPTGQIFMRFDI